MQGGLLKGLVRRIFRTLPSAFTVVTVSPPISDAANALCHFSAFTERWSASKSSESPAFG
jgi:hypothetical protein